MSITSVSIKPIWNPLAKVMRNLMQQRVDKKAVKYSASVLCAAMLMISSVSFADNSDQKPTTVEDDVSYLVEQMLESDCHFERNGTTYTREEAVEHLKNKWDYAKNKVESTEMFINEVASKSWFTGREYKVICGNGEHTSQQWFQQQLEQQ
ncbi:DUF5329 family protein [Enterovibrio calviensis]|uniref:DUF5329 family protein n=1 Tax=Enterovibrio calviensis TaxID=91359 RepID=UPI001FDF7803|nr:DUF5329 family protein [Enterovibrio calviensis]